MNALAVTAIITSAVTLRSNWRIPRLISAGLAEDESTDLPSNDPLTKRETLELVRAYYRISDPQVRRRIFDLAKVLAKASDPEEPK